MHTFSKLLYMETTYRRNDKKPVNFVSSSIQLQSDFCLFKVCIKKFKKILNYEYKYYELTNYFFISSN